MHVIRDASRGDHRNAVVPANSGQIFPESRKQFAGNEVCPFFGAEHKVNKDIRVFVGHPLNMHILYVRVCDACT
jgi:hypothetical protein